MNYKTDFASLQLILNPLVRARRNIFCAKTNPWNGGMLAQNEIFSQLLHVIFSFSLITAHGKKKYLNSNEFYELINGETKVAHLHSILISGIFFSPLIVHMPSFFVIITFSLSLFSPYYPTVWFFSLSPMLAGEKDGIKLFGKGK